MAIGSATSGGTSTTKTNTAPSSTVKESGSKPSEVSGSKPTETSAKPSAFRASAPTEPLDNPSNCYFETESNNIFDVFDQNSCFNKREGAINDYRDKYGTEPAVKEFSSSLEAGREKQEADKPAADTNGLLDGIMGWFGGGEEAAPATPEPSASVVTPEMRERARETAKERGISLNDALINELIKP